MLLSHISIIKNSRYGVIIIRQMRGILLAIVFAISSTGGGYVAVANAAAESPFFIGARFLATDGKIRAIGDEKESAGGAVMLFFADNCPISKQYARQINNLAKQIQKRGDFIYGVFLAADDKWQKARAFQQQHKLDMPIFADPSDDLITRAAINTTPAALSYTIGGKQQFAGNADKQFNKALTAAPKPCPIAKTAIAKTPPTYHKDIAPLLAANCLECHRTGGIAPFSLEQYDLARAFAPIIKKVVVERRMPPWKPKPQPGLYRNERILSARQIQLFADWADNGAPLGDKADTPPKAQLGDAQWRLGKPDLILKMPQPFQVPAAGKDIYRYFVLPSGLTEDKTLIGIDFSPGDTSVVHHANFFADYSGKARRKDAEDSRPGFSVFGTGAFMSYDNADDTQSFGIGGWVPGAEPSRRPMYGIYLPAGADIVIEIHYKLSGRAAQDQSSIAFYFSEKETPHYLDGILIGTQDLDIPAGDDDYRRRFYMDTPVGFTLVDFLPHMHYIGKEAIFNIKLPDGSERKLAHITDWDLDWQSIYALREPMHIPAGSRLEAIFSYDNSAANPENPHNPPQRIKWGWSSEEEMAEIWMGIIPDDWDDRDALIESSQASWYRSAKP